MRQSPAMWSMACDSTVIIALLVMERRERGPVAMLLTWSGWGALLGITLISGT